MPQSSWNPQAEDQPADIAIVTVIKPEYDAVAQRLPNSSYYKPRFGEVNSYAWRTAELARSDGQGAYRVVLAMPGHAFI
jgi:hypothetical protein